MDREQRTYSIGQVPHELRERVFGCGDPFGVRVDPSEIRLRSYAAEDWETLEEALDELPITTRRDVLRDELGRIDVECLARAEWLERRTKRPESAREWWARVLTGHHRRARRAMVRSDLPLEAWLRILSAFKFRCAYCDAMAFTVDHVTPMSLGGSNTPDNVVPACRVCNVAKGPRDIRTWYAALGRDHTHTIKRIHEVHARTGAIGVAA